MISKRDCLNILQSDRKLVGILCASYCSEKVDQGIGLD